VSAARILTEAERRLRAEGVLFEEAAQPRTQSRRFRNENQIKPGNNVYIEVVDKDRSRTDQPDRVAVQARASSGDRVRVELVETGPHTGVFRAALPTALRPPDATASDYTPGLSPLYAIDGDVRADRAWRGRADNRVPKWLTVDMKKLHAVTRIAWHRGLGAADRAVLRYILYASREKKEWKPIAWFPYRRGVLPGVKVAWEDGTYHVYHAARMLDGNGDLRNAWMGQRNREAWTVDFDLGAVMPLARTVLRPQGPNDGVRRYELYVEEKPGVYPAARNPKKASLEGWKKVYTSPVFDRCRDDTAAFEDVSARYVRLRVLQSWRDRPRIGEFEIYPRTRFKLTRAREGVGATIDLPPETCRYLKMLILEYSDDAPAVADFRVWAGPKEIVPSGVDVHALARNATLEMSPGDRVTVEYVDEVTTAGAPKTLRDNRLQATFYNATVAAIRHHFWDDERTGQRQRVDYTVLRVEPGDRFVVEITDYDADKTAELDQVSFTVRVGDADAVTLTARETGKFTGVFAREVDVADRPLPGRLLVRPGEEIAISYLDEENTDPGHPTERRTTLRVNTPSAGAVAVEPSVVRPDSDDAAATGGAGPSPKLVTLEKPLTVRVTDPDQARDTGRTVTVKLRTTSGVEQDLVCRIASPEDLERGVFTGRMLMQLGDKESPRFIVPEITAQRLRPAPGADGLKVPVLNVKGTDRITAAYTDERVPGAAGPKVLADTARLVTDGKIGVTDSEYTLKVDRLYIGGRLYLRVDDPCADVSDEADTVQVDLACSNGDKRTVALTETTRHSGVFTKSLLLEHSKTPDPKNDRFECDFGTEVTATYLDAVNTESPRPVARTVTAQVVLGSDGRVKAFEKKYPSKEIAVETQLRMGESYFELGRKHAALAKAEKDAKYRAELLALSKKELAQGAAILRTLLQNYPDSKKLADVAYLLAKLSEEQGRYHEAIEAYGRLVRHWPESVRAAEAQYRTGICYEKLNRFEEACDAYVELAYNHPKSSLVGDAMIRIGLHFNRLKTPEGYGRAARVFEKFIATRRDHPMAEAAFFQWAISLNRAGKYVEAAETFGRFIAEFPQAKPDIKASSLFWAGESYFKARNYEKAFRMYKRTTWDFPDSRWAKWARGRLTAREFDNIE